PQASVIHSHTARRCRRNYGGAPGPGMKDEQGSVTSGGVTVCDRGPPNTHTTFGFLCASVVEACRRHTVYLESLKT
ncbi:hypothetical protein JOQ06_017578, partial [Pogonophryne albipinna]